MPGIPVSRWMGHQRWIIGRQLQRKSTESGSVLQRTDRITPPLLRLPAAAAALRRAPALRLRLHALCRPNPVHVASSPPPPSPRPATGWGSLVDAASAGRPTLAPHPSASTSRATVHPSPLSAPRYKQNGSHLLATLTTRGAAQIHGRMMSSSPMSGQRPPPVSQMLFDNEAEVHNAQWVSAIEFLKANSPVRSLSTNKLNRELIGADHTKLTLSDVGIALLESLIYICLTNCNRNYNQKEYFKKENLLISPQFLHFRLEQIGLCKLDRDSLDNRKNCTGAYTAACEVFVDLLKEIEGKDVEKQLSVVVNDLFTKMKRPTDQRLIIFHPVLLRAQGVNAFFMRVFYLVKRIHRHLSHNPVLLVHVCDPQKTAAVRRHPLLRHILVNRVTNTNASAQPQQSQTGQPQPATGSANAQSLQNQTGQTQPKQTGQTQQTNESDEEKRMVLELPRHTIQHVFDQSSKQVKSSIDPSIYLWPYTEEQVLDLLFFVFGETLIEVEEFFLATGDWDKLGVENFWPRDFNRMGGVPVPTYVEQIAIRQAGLHLMDR